MAEKITYGVRNGHYAQVTHNADGIPSFGAVKVWTGWSEMSLPPVGDPLKVYADDVTYYKVHVNQGYDGTVSAYQVPEDFKVNHMGEYKDSNGVMVERSSAQPMDFALLGEFQTADDAGADKKRFVLYNCSAGRADFTGSTKTESVEPASFSIPVTVSPTVADELVKATITKSANESIFNAWFSSVYYNPSLVVTQRVTVTVTGGGNPVPGAIVVVGDKMAKTGTDGVALFSVISGTYDVMVSASGFTASTDSVTVESTAVSKAITLTEAG